MIRFIIVMGLYLFLALQVEASILPQIETLRVLPGHYEFIIGLRLLALGAVLAGVLRGETPGMLIGLIAAMLTGFSFPEAGLIGASIVSFTAAGYLAGLLARHFRLSGFFFRWFAIFFLLVVERMGFFAVRWFFWRDNIMTMPWLGMILTGLIGTLVYAMLSRPLKKNLFDVEA